jgi:hypothetical protein
MNRKKVLKILIFLIIFLLIILIVNTSSYKEKFTNIRKPEEHEHEYLTPILRLLYSDEINFIDSDESADIILAQKILPNINKPYILMNGEPLLRANILFNQALKDPYCVGCVVTSLDFDDTTKTFYLPMMLDRGHVSFTKSPFVRKYIGTERPYLAAYIAVHSPPHRDTFFRELRKLDSTVEGLGKANHTKDIEMKDRSAWWDTVDIYKDYKFGFAMENTMEKGYLTEKIMNVYIGGAIPLYWGSPTVKEIFNPESFIYLNDFPTLKDAAQYVYNLSKDEGKLKKMRESPIFLNNSKFEQYYNVPPPQWVVDIADKIQQNIKKIKR